MSASHTPGPWVRSVFGTQVLTGDSWNTICVLFEPKRDHRLAAWEDGRGATDAEANARLIAAAPELLAAAEHLLTVGEFCRTDDTECALRQLKAAIAKASGADQ